MSSIIAQQTKIDLELVPKEKILNIRKCNGRLNPRKIQRELTFQVVMDALALTPCYSAFLINADVLKVYMHQFWDSVYKHDTFYRFKMDKKKRFKLNMEVFKDIFKIYPRIQGHDFDALPTDEEIMSFLRDLGHTGEIHSINDVVGMCHQKNVDYVELLWEDFIYQIDNKAYKKQENMYYPRFNKVIIYYFLTQDKTLSWRNKIRMHTSKDDYLINTLRFVSAKEETKIYGAILPESLTSPKMKESKAYKTYLVSTKEPIGKSKRVKRPTKKSAKAPARGIIFRETSEMPLSKKKEKVDVSRGKGIELLSQVALTEDAQFEEGNDKDDSNNEQDSSGEDSDQKNDKSDQEENEEDEDDEDEVKEEIVKNPSNVYDAEDEIKITDKAEGDEDEEMDYTTKEGINAAMTNVQQGNESLKIIQVIEDAHVTLSTVP
ncbi:hypothetical protein Tco_1438915 [Tanacetum coccineum]